MFALRICIKCTLPSRVMYATSLYLLQEGVRPALIPIVIKILQSRCVAGRSKTEAMTAQQVVARPAMFKANSGYGTSVRTSKYKLAHCTKLYKNRLLIGATHVSHCINSVVELMPDVKWAKRIVSKAYYQSRREINWAMFGYLLVTNTHCSGGKLHKPKCLAARSQRLFMKSLLKQQTLAWCGKQTHVSCSEAGAVITQNTSRVCGGKLLS